MAREAEPMTMLRIMASRSCGSVGGFSSIPGLLKYTQNVVLTSCGVAASCCRPEGWGVRGRRADLRLAFCEEGVRPRLRGVLRCFLPLFRAYRPHKTGQSSENSMGLAFSTGTATGAQRRLPSANGAAVLTDDHA